MALNQFTVDSVRLKIPGRVLVALSAVFWVLWSTGPAVPEDRSLADRLDRGEAVIEPEPPWQGAGHGYRLSYLVDVPIRVFWAFKTDFAGDFLTSNRYIESHRLIQREPLTAVTENRYTHRPGLVFVWKTTLYPDAYRMTYRLLNPEECNQRFHFGEIQLTDHGNRTRVTQTAYFEFLGAWFWYHNPLAGGMKAFLRYTAAWEQETAARLESEYSAKP
ncbi:MAG: hypothetical protein ACOWWM_07605 [Desulfobacterales bacterium]